MDSSVIQNVVNAPSDSGIEEQQVIHRTYRMDMEHKRIIGMVDGKEAAMQQIWKELSTRRYAYLIYDDQYGNDLMNKVGNTDLTHDYLDNDIPAMIDDCITSDDIVDGVDNVDFEMLDRDGISLTVEVGTIYGDVILEGVLNNG